MYVQDSACSQGFCKVLSECIKIMYIYRPTYHFLSFQIVQLYDNGLLPQHPTKQLLQAPTIPLITIIIWNAHG